MNWLLNNTLDTIKFESHSEMNGKLLLKFMTNYISGW